MRINPKSEKGAITLIVLVSMLFLMALLMSMYIKIANKARTSAETTKQIQEQYNNIDQAETIYESYFANSDIIPIYTREHLEKIGSGEKITINNKIYTFVPDAYYTIQNNLDLGGYYDEETNTWEVEEGKEWTPITNEFTGILDGLGHTITGIYLGENEGTQGIFQELNGTVKNLHIKNSYKIKNMNGLLAGVNNGEIINCFYEKVLIGLKAGDYVNYQPTVGTYTVAGGEYGSGYTSNQSFTTENLKWRILSIDEKKGEIELIAEKQTSSTLYLQGANGYNHAVDILNDLCKKLYSDENRATARSITVEDINKKTTYDYTTYYNTSYGFTYGDTKQLSTYGADSMKYPNIYSLDKGYGTKGIFNNKTTGLDESKGLKDGVTDASGVTTYSTVTGYTDGNAAGTDPYLTYTYYSYIPESYLANLGINTAPEGLFKTGNAFWLASRCAYANATRPYFYVRYIDVEGSVTRGHLLNGYGSEGNPSFRVRPIVLLDTSVRLSKDTTNSTETITYWNIEY